MSTLIEYFSVVLWPGFHLHIFHFSAHHDVYYSGFLVTSVSVHSSKQLLSNLQPNWSNGFVLTACMSAVSCFWKNGKRAPSILFLEGNLRNEIKQQLDAVHGDFSPSMVTVKD